MRVEISAESLSGLTMDAILTQLAWNGYEVEFRTSGASVLARLVQKTPDGPRFIGAHCGNRAWPALLGVLMPSARDGTVRMEWREGPDYLEDLPR